MTAHYNKLVIRTQRDGIIQTNHTCLTYLSTAEGFVWFQWNFDRYFNRNISANLCCHFTGEKNKLLYLTVLAVYWTEKHNTTWYWKDKCVSTSCVDDPFPRNSSQIRGCKEALSALQCLAHLQIIWYAHYHIHTISQIIFPNQHFSLILLLVSMMIHINQCIYAENIGLSYKIWSEGWIKKIQYITWSPYF